MLCHVIKRVHQTNNLTMPPEAMSAVTRADADRWAEVIRRAGIRAD
jgi:hypothetical protein